MEYSFIRYHQSCFAANPWFSHISYPSTSPPLTPQIHKCVSVQSDRPAAAYTFNNHVTSLLAPVDRVEREMWHIIALLDYQHACLCVCVYLGGLPIDAHPLTPPSRCWLVATATVSPLFLMLLWDSDRQTWAEWQCVCGSGKRPTGTNKRRSRKTLPSLGSKDLQRDCLGWQEPSRYMTAWMWTLFPMFFYSNRCIN